MATINETDYSFSALLGTQPYFHSYQLGDPWCPQQPWMSELRSRIFALAAHPGAFVFPDDQRMRSDLVPLVQRAPAVLNGLIGLVLIRGGWAPEKLLEDFWQPEKDIATQAEPDTSQILEPDHFYCWPTAVIGEASLPQRGAALRALIDLVRCFEVVEPLKEISEQAITVCEKVSADPDLLLVDNDGLAALFAKHTDDEAAQFLPSLRGKIKWVQYVTQVLEYLNNQLSDSSKPPANVDEFIVAQIKNAGWANSQLPDSFAEIWGAARKFRLQRLLDETESISDTKAYKYWLQEILTNGKLRLACTWVYYATALAEIVISELVKGQPAEQAAQAYAHPQRVPDQKQFFKDLIDTVKHQPPSSIRLKGEEEGLEKLNRMIGLESVKNEVKRLASVAKMQSRRADLIKADSQSRHMQFLGNPGTGKTEVAQIMGSIFRDLGLLSKGHVVTVTRKDLVGEYVGGTGPKVAAKISEALGGVLFIDEAYTLPDPPGDNSGFGQEAITTLMTAMVDHKDDLVVIAAGYHNEMAEFIKSNVGLERRFATVLNFEDYTDDELVQIFVSKAQRMGYTLADGVTEKFRNLLPSPRPTGFGNAGEAIRILEKSQDHQAARIDAEEQELPEGQRLSEEQLKTLLPEDITPAGAELIDLDELKGSDPLAELDNLIGLAPIKKEVRELAALAKQDAELAAAGLASGDATRHMLFLGNPGTGKTVVARLMGSILKNLGLLAKGHVVEVSAPELIGQYVGQTAPRVQAKVEEALGGVLFIDEAYSLTAGSGGSSFGKEAVAELLRLMENHRDGLVVIAAGYEKEMNDFLNVNPGFKSRFSTSLDFPDYSDDELVQVFEKFASDRNRVLGDGVTEAVRKALPKNRSTDFANSRGVRNMFDAAVKRQALRLLEHSGEISLDDRLRIEAVDILPKESEPASTTSAQTNGIEKLDSLIGLAEVKAEVKKLVSVARANKLREEKGLNVGGQSRHLLFLGNPGTGKTTVARIMADVYRELGLLSKGHLVEVASKDLIAQFVGQTGPKVEAKVKEALGGVLFIDEAYSLTQGGSGNNFGLEAVSTLLKMMEDHRDDLVVIAAGYHREMDQFLASNTGLPDRFPKKLNFADYTDDELVEVISVMAKDNQLELAPGSREAFRERLPKQRSEHFANARVARTLFEDALDNQSMRVDNLSLTLDGEALLAELNMLRPIDIAPSAGDTSIAAGALAVTEEVLAPGQNANGSVQQFIVAISRQLTGRELGPDETAPVTDTSIIPAGEARWLRRTRLKGQGLRLYTSDPATGAPSVGYLSGDSKGFIPNDPRKPFHNTPSFAPKAMRKTAGEWDFEEFMGLLRNDWNKPAAVLNPGT